jgi:hypothetical protein
MILYEVTLEVEPSLASAVEEHMRLRHIPEIFSTGCFRRIRFQRSSSHRFRTTYEAESATDLERYLREHAPGLRAEFLAEFPSGVGLTRETWDDLEQWG